MPDFRVGKRPVGEIHPPLVIAEIGINHGGSIDVAVEMVDSACRAGAEVVKHQTHVVDDEMSAEAKAVVPGNAKESIYEIMRQSALDEADERTLMDYVHSKGMIFISTPFSREAFKRLQRFGVPAYKVGSGELNNIPLLREIASAGKPVILSTGMHSIESIEPAVQLLRGHKIPFALLHCTNLYPTPPHLVRLGAIQQLRETFPDAVVGLSDHTVDNLACLGAVALGASILERHFTDHKGRVGPDIVCSMDERELFELIHSSKILFAERGGRKTALDEEEVTRRFAFASVVAATDIEAGSEFTQANLWARRPGTGEIPAEQIDEVIGRRAAARIPAGTQLRWADTVQ